MTEHVNVLRFNHGMNTSAADLSANVKANTLKSYPQCEMPLLTIAGGGPSLLSAVIAKKSHVWALNDAAQALPLTPHAIVIMDGRARNAGFECVLTPLPTRYLLASQVHPAVYHALRGQRVEQWHAAGVACVDDSGWPTVLGGGTVLSRAINLAMSMGYRKFDLIGCDSSFITGGAHHAYPQEQNDNDRRIKALTPGGVQFETSPEMAEQAQQVCTQMKNLERFGAAFTCQGDGLLQSLWAEHRARVADVDTYEPDKYRRMWDVAAYRKHSPGERRYDEIMAALDPEPNACLIDFGCGTGRFAAKCALSKRFASVVALDFAENCIDPEAREILGDNFRVHNLWDTTLGIWGTPMCGGDAYGVCTDVMEHIPESKVDAVLENIAAEVKRAVFTISSEVDYFGNTIGERLHVTVKSPESWEEKLNEHFMTVSNRGNELYVCRTEG